MGRKTTVVNDEIKSAGMDVVQYKTGTMIRLEIHNRAVIIQDLPRKNAKALDRATSYYVEGFFYAPSFKARRWDGKEHLLKVRADGSYRLPAGLLNRIKGVFDKAKLDYVVEDRRERKKRCVDSTWGSFELRPYQKEAVAAFLKCDGPGILKMAIRSGKTVTAGSVIHELGVRTVFTVPSTLLLHQTAASLTESLGVDVGKIGDGEKEIGDGGVTVATIQSLEKMRQREDPLYGALTRAADLLIVDETHHAAADTWKAVTSDFDTYWVLGLTATPPLVQTNKGATRAGIWLTALAGEVVYEADIKDLIEGGYLVRPLIELHKITSPDLLGVPWTDGLKRAGVALNPERNGICVRRAIEKADEGERVLVVCTRTEQVEELRRLFLRQERDVPVVTGKMPTKERHKVIATLTSRETPIIITTVMGEGVDIPAVEVMINAAGGKSHIGTIQRMRNLTKAAGKTTALVIDFIDLHNGYLADHSRERLRVYREQGAFEFEVVE